MKIRIDFFKPTGKWYTTEEMDTPWPATMTFENFLRQVLTVNLEGKARIRYGGMTAVCLNWHGVPHLTTVPTDIQTLVPCVACKFEAAHGTEELPHPVDIRLHECAPEEQMAWPVGMNELLPLPTRGCLTADEAYVIKKMNDALARPAAPLSPDAQKAMQYDEDFEIPCKKPDEP